MSNIVELMSLDNPIFRAWVFYGSILVIKMLAMGPLTGKQRFTKKVFSNPEDIRGLKAAKVKFDDPDVERVRRAHLNDLENILIYFTASYFYLLTNPSALVAINLFRAFTVARIAHTFSYAIFPTQPLRAISYTVGALVTMYMAVNTVLTFM